MVHVMIIVTVLPIGPSLETDVLRLTNDRNDVISLETI